MKKIVAIKSLKGKRTLAALGLTSILLLSSCNSVESKDSTTSTDAPISGNKDVTPDLQMTASDLANQTLKNENFAWDRIGKRIELKNVTVGGTENLSQTEVNLWGNDGDVHYNGKYMCCRYIFKITDPEVIKAAQNSKGEIATITGTLTEYRDNQSTTQLSSEPITVKEFVFDNIKFEVSRSTSSAPQAPNEPVDEQTQEDNEATYNPFITVNVDKAYFYDKADLSTKRTVYLVRGEDVPIQKEEGDFVYIIYENKQGDITQGWMLRKEFVTTNLEEHVKKMR